MPIENLDNRGNEAVSLINSLESGKLDTPTPSTALEPATEDLAVVTARINSLIAVLVEQGLLEEYVPE